LGQRTGGTQVPTYQRLVQRGIHDALVTTAVAAGLGGLALLAAACGSGRPSSGYVPVGGSAPAGGDTATSAASGGPSYGDALGVDGISPAVLAGLGIYLGPPGHVPTGVSTTTVLAAPTTLAPGSPTQPATTPASPYGSALDGDRGSGATRFTAAQAAAKLREQLVTFEPGYAMAPPVLDEMLLSGPPGQATVWVTVVTGMADPNELSHGGVATTAAGSDGTTTRPTIPSPWPQRAVEIIDAVTGVLIEQASLLTGGG
jgi:hypothetical protein